MAPLLISPSQFQSYVDRAKRSVFDPSIIEAEDNSTMRSSYVLIDEYGRFLDTSTGGKVATRPILDVGLEAAVDDLLNSAGGGFDKSAYDRRGADYSDRWSRSSSEALLPTVG